MRARTRDGFTLVEFVVGIVFLAVVLGPLLLFVTRIQELNLAVAQQARLEGWRTLNDQALALGIDPSQARALSSESNPAVPALHRVRVESLPGAAAPGVPPIATLRVLPEVAAAETRRVGAGYQIGPGATASPRSTPTPPLSPIVLPAPVVTPPDGTIIAAESLAAGPPGDPYTTIVQAAAAAGTKVFVNFSRPSGMVSGPGVAQKTISASDFLPGVSGVAWAEYGGATGGSSMTLADGRTRWFVAQSDGRLQIYEPSPFVAFAYRIDLGAPILVDDHRAWGSGAVLSFDYATFAAVQQGTSHLHLDFSTAAKNAFGKQWPAESIGFAWTFQGVSGGFDGDVAPFFRDDALALWAVATPVAATTVAPAGAVARTAEWTFARLTTALGVPLLTTDADPSGFYFPGALQFRAPPGPTGTTIGRLSFQNGATVSTGATLSLTIVP